MFLILMNGFIFAQITSGRLKRKYERSRNFKVCHYGEVKIEIRTFSGGAIKISLRSGNSFVRRKTSQTQQCNESTNNKALQGQKRR